MALLTGFVLTLLAALVAAAPAAAAPSYSATGTAAFSDPGAYTWTVPDGVTKVTFQVFGAQGGSGFAPGDGGPSGGLGGGVQGILAVTPGQTFQLSVGGTGGFGSDGYYTHQNGAGGYGGGGEGGNGGYSQACSFYRIIAREPVCQAYYPDKTYYGGGGGGGGRSLVSTTDASPTTLLVAGGGGGGGGYGEYGPGGAGGDLWCCQGNASGVGSAGGDGDYAGGGGGGGGGGYVGGAGGPGRAYYGGPGGGDGTSHADSSVTGVTYSNGHSGNGLIVITPVTRTTLDVAAATGTYGGTADLSATLSSAGTGLSGLSVSFRLNGTAVGSAATNSSGVASLQNVSLAGINAGSYSTGVSASFAGDTGDDASSGTAALTVTLATQIITFAALPNKTYGDAPFSLTASASSGLPVSYSAGSTDQCTVTGSTVTLTGAGSCTITASQAGNTNYLAATSVSQTFTIAQASATVTLGNLTPTYDATTKSVSVTTSPADLATTVSYSQNGTAVASPTHAGSYSVAAAIADPNYTGSATGTLVISQASPVLGWSAPASIVYGTALGNSQLNATASFQDSPLAGSFAYTPASGSVLDAGTGQKLSASFTPTDTQDFLSGTVTTTIDVTPAPLTVSAKDVTKEYGAANPVFTGTLTGVVNNDQISASYSSSATASSPVGSYAIVPSLNDPNGRLGNYTVTSTNGTLTITPAKTTTGAQDASATYGAGSVALSASVTSDTGIAVGEGSVTFTITQGSTTLGTVSAGVTNNAAQASFPLTGYSGYNLDAGSYQVNASYSDGASPANFQASATSTTATLTITKAALSVTATTASMIYGASLPTLGGTLTGVVSPDGITVSDGTTATSSSPVGSYPIVPTLNDPNNRLGNYTVTSTNGTLTITPAHTATTAASLALIYGVSSATLSATVQNTDTSAVVNQGSVTFTLTNSTGTEVAQTSAPVAAGQASVSLPLAGLHAGTYTLQAAYRDTATPANFQASSGTASLALLYHFGGFLPPLQASSSTAHAGQAIPVKFALTDATGNPVSTAVATLSANGQPATSKGNSNSGDRFRYSAPDYIYNLDTSGLIGTVPLTVSLDDGTTHNVVLTISGK